MISAAGFKLEGKPLEAGCFIDLKDGEEIEFGDGKRYTIKYGGLLILQYQRPLSISVLRNCLWHGMLKRSTQVRHIEKYAIAPADGNGKSAAAKRWLVER